MRSLVVGTAGHIDHGKSALVRALTGTDPDRLKEEKERGITIDLGFAHMPLGDGLEASFIDVPGHERFVRNMLAGAHGIDAVVLVVAADEAVMPQTREHFHICRLLGVPRGLVVLTKCDAADPELQDLAEGEARALVAGSFLEGAPLLRVSARTGQGLEALRAALAGLARETAPRPATGLLRLPVDRAFTLHGFGTVVTGTLVAGALAVGDEVEVLPAGRRARVRGLQVHGRPAERVSAGSRAAVNLAGLDVSAVARGDVLSRPGALRPTSLVDVDLTLLPGARDLRDQARVRVSLAAAEVLARVRLAGTLSGGATARAQLRLERPAVAGRGDRIVVRAYSPATTIGGAVVRDPLASKKRPSESAPAAGAGDARAAALRMVEEAGPRGLERATLAARLTLEGPAVDALLAEGPEVVRLGDAWLSRAATGALADQVRGVLARYHRENPLRSAMPREELRARVFAAAPAGALEHVLGLLDAEKAVRAAPDGIALAAHAVVLSGPEDEGRRRLLAAAEEGGLAGFEPARLAEARLDASLLERVARVLVADGALRRVGPLLVAAAALDRLKEDVRGRFAPGARVEVGAVKEMTGLSRKFVIPLLEYLDRERVTRRTGSERVLL
jgi:selenocysteine-specific elongation factor